MSAGPPDSGRKRIAASGLAYAVCGGPIGWLAQINLDYPLLATPCFSGADRNLSVPAGAVGTIVAAAVLYVGILLFAAGSGLTAYFLFKRLTDGRLGSASHFEQAGTGVSRFLAFWGILLGFGFSIVILLNAIAFLMIPPCAL